MTTIFDEFPTRGSVVDLSTTELANRLLLTLAGDSLNRHNFLLQVGEKYGVADNVSKAFLAAWGSLVNRGFLVEKGEPGWFFVSDAGEEEKNRLRQVPSAPSRHRTIANRWIVERELSGGGQGVTSVVRDKQGSPDERFVLKELRNNDEQARQRFAAETRALLTIDHPNILRIIDFNADATPAWYVSEYCAGHGLDKALLAELSVSTRFNIFLDVCKALSAAHTRRITHRDIKPENVLLKSSSGPAVLGDFGICWFVEANDERLTRAHEDIGSSFCRAPELFDGPVDPVLPTSDVYCLGKLLYWLMVGQGGRAGRLRTEEFERGNKNLVEIFHDPRYEHINEVLRRMITEDPAVRLKDASEVLDACMRAFDLFTKGFQPINTRPLNCNFCGKGQYSEHPTRAATSAEAALREDWRIFECNVCGHTLFFRRNDLNLRW